MTTEQCQENPIKRAIIRTLQETDHSDLTAPEIANKAEISYSAVYDHIYDLEDNGIITATRETGGATMWKLNND